MYRYDWFHRLGFDVGAWPRRLQQHLGYVTGTHYVFQMSFGPAICTRELMGLAGG